MHPAARSYVAVTLGGTSWRRVVEVGGRNVNGGVRDLFTAQEYTSIDLEDGPDVDVVGDCRTWRPPWPADLVVCCEVLEHAPDPQGVTQACIDYLATSGRLVLTCAGPGRAPHSGHDGGGRIYEGEHYGNIDPADLRRWLRPLAAVAVTFNAYDHDVYATGVRR